MRSNRLEGLPHSVSALTKLTLLDVYDNDIHNLSFVSHLPRRLQSLSITCSRPAGSDATFDLMPDLTVDDRFANLTSLALERVDLSKARLHKLSKLKSLVLIDCFGVRRDKLVSAHLLSSLSLHIDWESHLCCAVM